MNHYYEEKDTFRYTETTDTAKTKNLYMAWAPTNQYEGILRFVETLNASHTNSSPANSRAVPCGTTVTADIATTLQFISLRAPTTASYTISDDESKLYVVVDNIYSQDAADTDAGIFIDAAVLAPNYAANVTAAILPIRHGIQQVCTEYPNCCIPQRDLFWCVWINRGGRVPANACCHWQGSPFTRRRTQRTCWTQWMVCNCYKRNI